jgi:hypothetical protein
MAKELHATTVQIDKIAEARPRDRTRPKDVGAKAREPACRPGLVPVSF